MKLKYSGLLAGSLVVLSGCARKPGSDPGVLLTARRWK